MNTKNYTLGLDLGDRRSTYCLLDVAGKIEAEDAVATSRECFEALSARYPASVIAMETGTHCSTHRPQSRAPVRLTLRFAPGRA